MKIELEVNSYEDMDTLAEALEKTTDYEILRSIPRTNEYTVIITERE